MFSHFDAAARAVCTLAEQECRNASHYYLGTEHLLLAMAIAPPADVADCFRQVGIDPWAVKRLLREHMEPPADHPWEGVVITPRVQRVFALAAAGKSDASPVEPIDLLRAIEREGGGVAARVLAAVRANRRIRASAE